MIDELQKIHTNDNNKNVKNKLSIKLAPKVDYGIELQCIECSKEFSTREHYMEHFQVSSCLIFCETNIEGFVEIIHYFSSFTSWTNNVEQNNHLKLDRANISSPRT